MITAPGIYNWLASQTNRPVIYADQDGTSPELPFVTLKVLSENRLGHAHQESVDADGDMTITQPIEYTVSVNVYGDDALAISLCRSLEKPTVQQALNADDVAFVDVVSGPTDVAAVLGTGWEPRTNFDVRFRSLMTLADAAGLIESVEINSEINGVEVTQIVEL